MKLKDYLLRVAPRAVYYKAARRGWVEPINPLTLTFSVTAACQSLCKTCNIGSVYLANPALAKRNLTLEEVEKVFRSLGPVYFFNISGGEPFMRPDLPEIVRLACIHLKPKLIHIPTNGIGTRFIEKTTRRILAYMDEYSPRSVPITIKPSIDGVGEVHDYVRGYKGNFAKLERTIQVLLAIRKENPRLHVDLGTVISNHNLEHLDEIEDWVHAQGIESYRHEIAEQRAEFHNLGDPITPSAAVYETLIQRFKQKILTHVRGKAPLTVATEAVRMVYYDVAAQILKERRQVTACYGGISNIHMNYNGVLWPCCVLGGDHAMGRVHDFDYDIKALLRSQQAAGVRKYIADGNCACPLANQWLNNVLLTPKHMLKVLYTYLLLFRLPARFVDRKTAPIPLPVPAPAADGKTRRVALVNRKFGTIPVEQEVDLPEHR
jgi:MoaA/NifB/PqqE/SkfB family radical SAM enzyme